jgi:hypothetical protein
VLPGVYHLWAFGAGNIGAFKQANIEVRAGKALDLGTVRWTPSRVAGTLWEIGVPDRDSNKNQVSTTPFDSLGQDSPMRISLQAGIVAHLLALIFPIPCEVSAQRE